MDKYGIEKEFKGLTQNLTSSWTFSSKQKSLSYLHDASYLFVSIWNGYHIAILKENKYQTANILFVQQTNKSGWTILSGISK